MLNVINSVPLSNNNTFMKKQKMFRWEITLHLVFLRLKYINLKQNSTDAHRDIGVPHLHLHFANIKCCCFVRFYSFWLIYSILFIISIKPNSFCYKKKIRKKHIWISINFVPRWRLNYWKSHFDFDLFFFVILISRNCISVFVVVIDTIRVTAQSLQMILIKWNYKIVK